MSELPTLESLIPHRAPMLLLDSISSLDGDKIVAHKVILADSFFLKGHYPHFPIVPGVITCECIFQAGAALLSFRTAKDSASADSVPVIARIENAKFREAILPGHAVSFHVKVREQMGQVFFLSGEARVNEKLMASVEFSCALKAESK